jgi:hypothetical protein
MGTVVRRIMSEPQPTRTFSLTTQTLTNGRIINAEIRQPKSEKGTAQHPSPLPPVFPHSGMPSIDLDLTDFLLPLTDI